MIKIKITFDYVNQEDVEAAATELLDRERQKLVKRLAESAQKAFDIKMANMYNNAFSNSFADPFEHERKLDQVPLTMADIRRDCFPKEYTWYMREGKNETH